MCERICSRFPALWADQFVQQAVRGGVERAPMTELIWAWAWA